MSTPRPPPTNSGLFPPATRAAQVEETGSFVGPKPETGDPKDPADAPTGAGWDALAYDPEHRRVVAVVPGAWTSAHAAAVVAAFPRRTGGRPMDRITRDEPRPYQAAILQAEGGRRPSRPAAGRCGLRTG